MTRANDKSFSAAGPRVQPMKTAWPQGQAIDSIARPAGAQAIGYRLKLATASIGVGEFEQQSAARQAHWD